MIVHRNPGRQRGFGAALNAWMWRELHPGLFDSVDDGVNFVGLGSMLDQRLPAGGLNVVLGTGMGRAAAADGCAAPPHWRIYGVRGPLTAQLLNLPAAAVLTDPAILLARHARWQHRPSERGGVVFVPQGRSARFGQWSAVCAMVGIDFVDPRGEARDVIDRIAGASLVIGESLHAVVIADALRVPWIPVVLSREVEPFDWADWAATLGIEYTPLLLAPSSPVEALRVRLLAHSSFARIGSFGFQAGKDGGPRELAWTRAQLLHEHRRSTRRAASPWRRRLSAVAHSAIELAAQIETHAPPCVLPASYRRYRDGAAAQLRQVMASPSQLSSDDAHGRALSRCAESVERLHADRRAGRFSGWPAGAARVQARLPLQEGS